MTLFKKAVKPLLIALPLISAQPAFAADVSVEITNLTHGIYFTPILISSHGADSDLFEVGEAASTELQTMAEGGDISGLDTLLVNEGAINVTNPAEGLLAPAASTSATLDTETNGYLSIVAMMLPTNDGFIGLDNWSIPSEAGTYTVYLNAYDAGTEANDEIVNGGGAINTPGIPANPGSNGGSDGTGVTTEESNETVHIHRGSVGDIDATGGASDLDSRVHRWLNPVARVVITVSDAE
jgi:hypothetical protein